VVGFLSATNRLLLFIINKIYMSETKKCNQCQLDIPAKAKKCGHCQSSTRVPLFKRKNFWIAMGIFFVWFLISSISSLFSSPTPTPTYTQNTVQKAPEVVLGTYSIDTTELKSNGLDDSSVRLWKSYSDRKLVMNIPKNSSVELLQEDEANNYCKIRFQSKVGWLDCGWLK
jgi:hypothetical protein